MKEDHAIMLVSSPGHAVLDSGCGKSIIGAQTLDQFRKLWTKAGIAQPAEHAEVNSFRFGNGQSEVSQKVVEMPVTLGGKRGLIRAAVIQGEAPVLLSRPASKKLEASMNFAADELIFFDWRFPPWKWRRQSP